MSMQTNIISQMLRDRHNEPTCLPHEIVVATSDVSHTKLTQNTLIKTKTTHKDVDEYVNQYKWLKLTRVDQTQILETTIVQ